jgi:hypothetical protein
MINTLSGDDLARFAAAHHAYQEHLSRVARERERFDAETLRQAMTLSAVNDAIVARYVINTLSGDDLARFAAAHHAYQEHLSRVARERERTW